MADEPRGYRRGSKVNRWGFVHIPKKLLEQLGLTPGEEVKVEITPLQEGKGFVVRIKVK